MSLQQSFSNSMKAIFKSRKKNMTAFSSELGIARSTLQGILKGNSNSRLDTIELIAQGLHTNPATLLSASYTEEEWSILIPLLQFGDAIYALPNNEKSEVAEHLHAIVRILTARRPEEPK